MSDQGAAAAKGSQESIVRWTSLGALALGVAAVLMWIGGVVALFMNLDTDENGLAATAALLVIVVLAAALTLPAKSGGSTFALISAGVYAGLWVYLRVGFHRMMPDALLMVLTLLFYLAPLITGITAIAVGRKGFSRARPAASPEPAE